jgi:hypothetical protein
MSDKEKKSSNNYKKKEKNDFKYSEKDKKSSNYFKEKERNDFKYSEKDKKSSNYFKEKESNDFKLSDKDKKSSNYFKEKEQNDFKYSEKDKKSSNYFKEKDNYLNSFKYSEKEKEKLFSEKEKEKKFVKKKSIPKAKKQSDNIFSKENNIFRNEEKPFDSNSFKPNYKKSNELLFNPKTSKNKPIEPLFSKYERLQGQNQSQNITNNNNNVITKEPHFKKSQDIFPSQLGVEMPYKSKLKERLYNKDNLYSNYRASFKKDNSSSALDKRNDSKKQFQKFEKKTYFSYKSNLKSDNPFKGPSKFEKSIKERKDHISKTVEKEENEFYDIAIIEEKISVKKELNNEELNQLINKFNEMMYKEY